MSLPFRGREPGVGRGCGRWSNNHSTGGADKWVWFAGQPLGLFANKHAWQEFTNPVKRVELKFNGKEETLRPDWTEDSRHGEGKSDNKGEL